MSYCRFRNTLGDLHDCYDALLDGDDLSVEECQAAGELVRLCREISVDWESDEFAKVSAA
jgi:hypothetical protein